MKILHAVEKLLETLDIYLSGGAGIPKLVRFQKRFREYKIVVYRDLSCDDIIFEGRVDSTKRLNILYDDVERHYHVIAKLTGAMAKRFVCEGCNITCKSDVTHACDQTCSDCMTSPPCAFSHFRYPCAKCNSNLRSHTCFVKHKQFTSKKISMRCPPQVIRYCAYSTIFKAPKY